MQIHKIIFKYDLNLKTKNKKRNENNNTQNKSCCIFSKKKIR